MSTTRVTIPVMGVCIALSVIVHVGSAISAGAYLSQRPAFSLGQQTRIELPDLSPPSMPQEQPLRLGREESRTASIAWLGVVRDAVEGQGQESQVEQAELTINEGQRDEQATPVQQPTPPSPAQPTAVVAQPQAETKDAPQPEEAQPQETRPEPQVSEPDQAEQPTPDREPEPIEPESPAQDEEPEALIESSEQQAPVVQQEAQPEPEPQAEPEAAEPQEETTPASPQPVTEPSLQPSLPTTSPRPQGKPGEVDDRESVASIIKRAQEVRASSLNRPLSGEGLEIKTVEPRFPASVRFTQLPRNPIVLIRFNAQGKVVKAEFLRDEEKRRVYDTGSPGVDAPLINAIYQWRATGKQLDGLDPQDPESMLEISMKIIFRDED